MANTLIISPQQPENEPLCFEVDEYDKYVFPYEDEVPEGLYYALIKKVENSETKYHDPCFDVCLKLLSIHQPYAYDNGHINKLTYHYIRQRYKLSSEPARKFRNSMHAIGFPKKFTADDLENTTATIYLEYCHSCKIGNVSTWKKDDTDLSWFTADEAVDDGIQEEET